MVKLAGWIKSRRLSTAWAPAPQLRSIRGRLAFLFALAFLPTGLVAADAGRKAYESRRAALQQALGAAELKGMSQARDAVTRLKEVTRTLAANANLFSNDKIECASILARFAEKVSSFDLVALLDEKSQIRCSNLPRQATSFAAGHLISAATYADDVVIGLSAAPKGSDALVLTAVSKASVAGLGAPRFVALTSSLPGLLSDHQASNSNQISYAALVSRDGRLLDLQGLKTSSPEARQLIQILPTLNLDLRDSAFSIGAMWAVIMPLDDQRIYLLKGWSAQPSSLSDLTFTAWALLMPILLWGVAVSGVWYALEIYVVRPLQEVEEIARAYARGLNREYTERPVTNASTEIISLRRTLAAMARTLRGREAKLSEALQEERSLLREINHRVKNNLQMISSLLAIQGRASEAGEARALRRANDRVQLLTIAHNFIYGSGAVREVSLDGLATEISHSLSASRMRAGFVVKLELDLQSMTASADQALPYAFLFGECLNIALDNAAKAPSPFPATISIRLIAPTNDSLHLTIDSSVSDPMDPINQSSQRIIDAFALQVGAKVQFEFAAHPKIILDISSIQRLLTDAPE